MATRKSETKRKTTSARTGGKGASGSRAAKKPPKKKTKSKTAASKRAAPKQPAVKVGKPKAARKPPTRQHVNRSGGSTRAEKSSTPGRTAGGASRTATAGSPQERRPAAGRQRRAPSALRVGIGAAIGVAKRAARVMARALPVRPSARKRRAAGAPGAPGIAIKGRLEPRYHEILTPSALRFLAELHRNFDKDRKRLLAERAEQQERYDAGERPDFLPTTKPIRDGEWKVAAIPPDLLDRRVEITGPVDRKMIINALNSGANVFMADFEDANSPTWSNNLDGQINLKDRFDGTIAFTDPESGKDYRLNDDTAVLIVRPRGWHLLEEHVTVDGEPISAALFDFGLAFFHNTRKQIDQGTGPYFYLPKLETHREARLWNDVFVFAQDKLGFPRGTIRATVLIETLPAAFEMDEILWELREHVAGLNAGRWDYIFSFIKKFAKNSNYVLPDRSQVVMGEAFLGAYAALLVRTCHRRGAFAMGGMAAQIPVKNDPAANEAAFAKVRADKEREVRDGYDGTWVAHPDLVPVAKEVFDRMMPDPNQLQRVRLHVNVRRDDLLKIHAGTRTEEGFRLNIRVGVQYIEAWLRGRGAVPIYNLMEDAATAEISRAQIWQWIRYGVELDTGIKATPEFFRRAIAEEMERVKDEIGAEAYEQGRFPEAIQLFSDLSLAPQFEDFLTIPAYRLLV